MMNTASDSYPSVPEGDPDVSIVDIANTVLRNWRLLVILPIVLACATGAWSLTRDRTYAAYAAFMPQAADTRGAGGAAALAQQFGVTLGAERPGQSPQFYVDLLRSRTLMRQALQAEYQLADVDGEPWKGTLMQYWQRGETGRDSWRRATDKLRRAVSASVARETGVVHMTVAIDNPTLAEAIAHHLLQLLNEFNLEVRQNRALEEGRFISGRVAEAQADLLTAEAALQEFLRQNRQFRLSPELNFEHDRLQREVMMQQEVYTSLLRSREQARIDGMRDTPLVTVIDPPAGTAEPQGRGTARRAALAGILGLMFAVLLAFGIELARRSRASQDPRYREFQRLIREAGYDLPRPRQWLRGRKGSRAVLNAPESSV
jgi:uncharacterized protein involved in exopolysaccharide biosynthesis